MQTPESRKQTISNYRNTPHGKAVDAWHSMKQRVNKRPSYSHVQIKITQEEFMRWAEANFDLWMQENMGYPTVDRKDGKGHYEIGNIQVVSRSENSQRQGYNWLAPEGTSWCTRCQDYLPVGKFSKRAGNRLTGADCRCKDCAIILQREYRAQKRQLNGNRL